MEQPLHILVFDPSNRNPVHSACLIDELAKRCNVKVVMPYRSEESNIPAGASLSKLRVYPRKTKVVNGVGKLIRYIGGWGYVLTHARKFDVIHIEWLSMLDYIGIELLLIRILLKINPHITYTAHDVTPLNKNGNKTANRFRTLYRIVPTIIVHSHFAKNELISVYGVIPEKVHVHDLAPLLAVEDDKGRADDRRHIGIIGTLSTYKGIFDTIKAFALIASKIQENLLLAGGISDDDTKTIQRMISELNIQGRVVFIGRYLTIQEVIDMHKKMKVILLPYHRITQSGAALTSLSLGVPVVAYDIGGLREIINDGSTGFIVPFRNIEALADAVLRIIKNEDVDYYSNCTQYAKSKSWSAVAIQTINTYESLLTRHYQ